MVGMGRLGMVQGRRKAISAVTWGQVSVEWAVPGTQCCAGPCSRAQSDI